MRGKGGGEREERGRGREGRQSEETREEGDGKKGGGKRESERGREVKRREKGGERRQREKSGREKGGGEGGGERREGWKTHMLTMKGCRIEARMDFSLLTCSTCLSRITSEMVMILRAKNCLVGMSRASTTRPNVPVPEYGGVWGEGV